MNPLERHIYSLVKKNPRLKNTLVDLYQKALGLVPVKAVELKFPIHSRAGFFFGFHDKCPWSPDQSMLLAHRFGDLPLRLPCPDDEVEIGYFTGQNWLEFHAIATTRAWNWQKGAMLQWLGQSDRIIFNDFDGHKLIARIVDPAGREQQRLDRPIAAVHPDGNAALAYSFGRLKRGAPGYAYANGSDPDEAERLPENDGLYHIDIASGALRPLFSIAEVNAIAPEFDRPGAYHYVTHCLYNPTGTRFAFYQRQIKDGAYRTRLLSAAADGENLHVFPTAGMVSHIGWRDDTHLLAYASTEKFGDGYFLFTDQTDEFEPVGATFFTSDGHPQFAPDGQIILTDTYPDRFRRQSLLIYNCASDSGERLARLRIPPAYRYDVRCDFHPRWSRDGKHVCFDSAHSGVRSLCTMTLNNA